MAAGGMAPAQLGRTVSAAMRVLFPGLRSSSSSSTSRVPSLRRFAMVTRRRATSIAGPADVVSYTSSGRSPAVGRAAVSACEKYAIPRYQLLTTYSAAVSGRATVRTNAPRSSVRTESIGAPPPPMVTRCSTTHEPASGRPPGPPSRTRPETTKRCARSLPPPPPRRQSNASALRSELPEVFRIEVLEVGLQLVGIERPLPAFAAGLSRLDRRQREQALAREDRRLEPQGDGDRVGRPGVDLDHGVAAVDVQLGVVGVVLDLGDEHLPQVRAESQDHLLEQVVGERTRELHAGELHRDRAGLGGPDPDRQHTLAFLLLQDDDRGVGRAVEPQVCDANLDDVRAQVPSSQDVKYFCCSGVSLSIVTPIACSLSRAISASSSRGMRWTSFVRLLACFTTNSAASA